MPTMTLTVTGGTVGLGWGASGAPTAVHAIGSDDGLTASGSSYATCSINLVNISDIDMSAPSVAEGAMDATNPITSVRFLGVGRMPGRGASGTDLDIKFDVPDGHRETLNFFNNVNYEVEYGTTRTEKPDSSAWEYSDIEGLEFNIVSGSAAIHLAYFAVEVVYVAAAVAADNATFFGANF